MGEAMLAGWKKRLLYLLCTVVVIVLGLGSRRYGEHLPAFVAQYAGDTLWALMVFLGISFVAPGTRVFYRGAMAIAFAFSIEISQLYHAPWIDTLRRTTLGALVLGSGFLWTDFICYVTGVAFGVLVDVQSDDATNRRPPSGPTRPTASRLF